jgi:hypothetical protein
MGLRLCTFALAATTISMVAPPAHADWKKKIAKGAKDVGKKVEKGAKDAAKEVKKVYTSDEAGSISTAAKQSYSTTVDAGKSAYEQAVEQAKKAETATFKAAGEAAIKQYSGFLGSFRDRINGLNGDDNKVAVLKRLTQSAASKKLDDDAKKDMTQIREWMGFGKDNTISPGGPSKAYTSSFGFLLGAGGGVGLGANVSFGVIMDSNNQIGLLVSSSGAVGAIFDAEASYVFFWQPGGMDSADGASVGLSFGAQAGAGGVLGLQWSVSKGMAGAEGATPGFYLGPAAGAGVSATLQGGYTWIPVKG